MSSIPPRAPSTDADLKLILRKLDALEQSVAEQAAACSKMTDILATVQARQDERMDRIAERVRRVEQDMDATTTDTQTIWTELHDCKHYTRTNIQRLSDETAHTVELIHTILVCVCVCVITGLNTCGSMRVHSCRHRHTHAHAHTGPDSTHRAS